MKKTKIAFIGTGAVGLSALFSAMHQHLAAEYGLIDINKQLTKGNQMDFADSRGAYREGLDVREYEYGDLKDADFVVISAGAFQLPGQDRNALIATNKKIIESIGAQVKASGFDGITVIMSNPVDSITYFYYKATGFARHKVIGSGTILDTNRLRLFIGDAIGVSPLSIEAYVLGEHGDSSLVAFDAIRVGGIKLAKFNSPFTLQNYEAKLEIPVRRRAYDIIDCKKATFYGIGTSIVQIIRAIVHNSREIITCGAVLAGEYGHHDVVAGTPCVLDHNGIKQVLEVDLTAAEKAKFDRSIDIVKTNIKNNQ